MELNRLQALITGGVTVSDNAVREAYRVQGTKVKFDYAVDLRRRSAQDHQPHRRRSAGVLQAELRPATRPQFPRRARLSMLPSTPPTCPAASRRSPMPRSRPTTTSTRTQYQVKEQVKVRHILIAVPAGADAKTDAAAKAKAEDVLKQIKAGGNFADLAEEVLRRPRQQDPGRRTRLARSRQDGSRVRQGRIRAHARPDLRRDQDAVRLPHPPDRR